jgi:phosphocarrier protein
VVKGRRASARNIVAVMLLTASVGTTVRLETDGPDEVAAMREIAALFHDGFGERS